MTIYIYRGGKVINFYYLLNFLECGHFCLRYVFKKEKIEPCVEYPKQMMSMRLLRDILKEYFEYVKCYKVEDGIEHFIDYRPFVTLIEKNGKYKHYVVVERIEDEYVFYYDPLFIKLRKKKVEYFNQIWSKECCFYFKKSNC